MARDLLLAIDSSTELLCVAACAGDRVAAWSGPGGSQASQSMFERIRLVLGDLGLEPGDLQAIGFGRGPGAFTGLRAACAVAQGLAFGLERPVVPVDSLLIVAEAARMLAPDGPAASDLGVLMDARMNEVYAARFGWDGSVWDVLQPPGLWTPAALAAAWSAADAPQAWVGTGLGLLPPDPSRPVVAARDEDRAQALLRLVRQRWQSGGAVPAAQALPIYVRDKVASTTAERASAALGNAA
mgnify:CR=1 FL=1